MAWIKGQTSAYNKNRGVILRYLRSQFSGHTDSQFCVEVRQRLDPIRVTGLANKAAKHDCDYYTFKTPSRLTQVVIDLESISCSVLIFQNQQDALDELDGD
jgi:hypothetical protein